MKRLVGIVLAVTALSVATVGCGSSSDSSSSDSGSSTSTLTVCSDIPYAPFEYEENGKVVGIDVDIVTAIGKNLGRSVKFLDTDFDGIFAALTAGRCDMIASAVSITPERQKSFLMSDPYYDIVQSLLVRKSDQGKITSLDDMVGKTLAVQSETTGEAYAKDHAPDGVTIKSFTGADEMFTALKAGQVDGILQDLPINAYNAKQTGETVVAVKFTDQKESYGFVVDKSDPKLMDDINAGLKELKASDQYQQILDKYLQ